VNTATANHQITRAFVPADSVAIVRALDVFLVLFFPDLDEPIYWRAFKPTNAPNGEERFKPVAPTTSRRALLNDASVAKELRRVNLTRGLYFVPNSGGNYDKDIDGFNAWFAEADNRTIPEQHAALDELPLPPSMRVETLRSVHAYWLAASRLPKASGTAWRDVQRGLIARLDGDPVIKNPSRVMRMPGFDHVTYNVETHQLSYHPVKLVECDASRRYTADEMWECFPSPVEEPKTQPPPDVAHTRAAKPSGADDLYSKAGLNAAAGRWIMQYGRPNGYDNNYVCKCPAHNGTSDSSLFYNPSTGAIKCTSANSTCSYSAILLAIGLPAFPLVREATYTNGASAHVPFQPPPERDGKAPADKAPPPHSGDPQSNNGDTAPEAEWNCTDTGNGYRFKHQHGADVRYCYSSKHWFAFDGRRWLEDAGGEVKRRAKQTARNILNEAARTENEEKRRALIKYSIASENCSKLGAMLEAAECELEVKLDVFDTDLMAFNCANGTIDLRTGHLRPHESEDMLSKISKVVYNPEAVAPRWLAFLHQIFAGDQSLIDYVQKSVGYSLTGDTSEQCLFLLHGTGANGKSVLLKTITALTSEYAQQVQTDSLMVKKNSGVNNDIAALRGARFLSAVETEADHKLAESLVKHITGGDKVSARFLFHEYFEFTPQFKIWLAANHKPQVKGNDHAIWRRIKLIPFDITIPQTEQNPKLDLELREELSGILNWALEGCLRWQVDGLGEPQAVTDATAAYKLEQDSLAGFLSDTCETGKLYQVTAKELYAAYERWCSTNGETTQPSKWLGEQLKERGFQADRNNKHRFWRGIGLKRHTDDD
jgi:putative DNA primase/helicase